MAFSLLFPGGLAFGERLPAAFVNQFDANLASAIDGVGGGTYAPSSAITIGGAGLNLTGSFTTSGDTQIGASGANTLTVIANASFINDVTLGNAVGDAITINGTSTFNQPATFASTSTFTGTATFNGAIVANDDVTLGSSSGDTLTVNADTTFQGPVTFEDQISFSGTIEISGDVSFTNDVTLGDGAGDLCEVLGDIRLNRRMLFAGSGRVPLRVFELPDADATVTVADGNHFLVPTVTLDRDYTIGDTGASDGDFMVFFQGKAQTPGGGSVHIDSPTTDQDVTFTSGNEQLYVKYVRVSGDWLQLDVAFL